MTTAQSDLQEHLIRASQVAARLVKDGIPVNEIRIRGRARPAVQIRARMHEAHTPSLQAFQGIRYAWGCDQQGGYERYAMLIDGVQVQWEVRCRRTACSTVLPFKRRAYDG